MAPNLIWLFGLRLNANFCYCPSCLKNHQKIIISLFSKIQLEYLIHTVWIFVMMKTTTVAVLMVLITKHCLGLSKKTVTICSFLTLFWNNATEPVSWPKIAFQVSVLKINTKGFNYSCKFWILIVDFKHTKYKIVGSNPSSLN